ncbi:hypothetical protein HC928_02565 [bacterium]|nr:hypothetical protein [bacterium]
MSLPILSTGTSRIWIEPRDPTNDENENVEIGNFWINQNTGSFFVCTNHERHQNLWRQFTFSSHVFIIKYSGEKMGIPGLSQFNQKAVPLSQRSIAAESITSSYALVGTIFSSPVLWLCIVSTLNAVVQISLNGTTDFVAIPVGDTVPAIITIPFKEFNTVLSGNFGIYVKEIGNPSAGNLYISAISI